MADISSDWLTNKASNLILERLAKGLPVTMIGVRMARSAEVARLAQASGNHALWIDLEHSAWASTWPCRSARRPMTWAWCRWCASPSTTAA